MLQRYVPPCARAPSLLIDSPASARRASCRFCGISTARHAAEGLRCRRPLREERERAPILACDWTPLPLDARRDLPPVCSSHFPPALSDMCSIADEAAEALARRNAVAMPAGAAAAAASAAVTGTAEGTLPAAATKSHISTGAGVAHRKIRPLLCQSLPPASLVQQEAGVTGVRSVESTGSDAAAAIATTAAADSAAAAAPSPFATSTAAVAASGAQADTERASAVPRASAGTADAVAPASSAQSAAEADSARQLRQDLRRAFLRMHPQLARVLDFVVDSVAHNAATALLPAIVARTARQQLLLPRALSVVSMPRDVPVPAPVSESARASADDAHGSSAGYYRGGQPLLRPPPSVPTGPADTDASHVASAFGAARASALRVLVVQVQNACAREVAERVVPWCRAQCAQAMRALAPPDVHASVLRTASVLACDMVAPAFVGKAREAIHMEVHQLVCFRTAPCMVVSAPTLLLQVHQHVRAAWKEAGTGRARDPGIVPGQ